MSVRGPGFWGYRWEGYSHQELYDLVKGDVRGAGAVGDASRAWSEFVALMDEARARTDQLLRDAGVEWQGTAAETMNNAVSPLAAWADQAATAGRASNGNLEAVAEAFARTANSMPEPVAMPSEVASTEFGRILAGQVDEDAASRASQQARLRAVELMNTYTAHNRDAVGNAGTFDDPLRLGVGVSLVEQRDGDHIRVAEEDPEQTREVVGEPAGPRPGVSGPLTGDRSGTGGGSPAGLLPVPDAVDTSSPSSVITESPGTTPAQVVAPEARPGGGGAGAPTRPFTPVPAGLDPVAGPGPGGRAPDGATSRGPGATTDSKPVSGRVPGRGGATAVGPLAAAESAATRSATQSGGAQSGGARGGFVPGAGGRGDDDQERTSPAYLQDFHDEFWDDSRPVAPPVIGEDDD